MDFNLNLIMKKNYKFLITLFFSSSAIAANPSPLLICSAIQDSIKRLACFDDLAKTEQKIADKNANKSLNVSESKYKNWELAVSQSKIDDSKTVILMTHSKDSVLGRFKKQAIPIHAFL